MKEPRCCVACESCFRHNFFLNMIVAFVYLIDVNAVPFKSSALLHFEKGVTDENGVSELLC